MQRVRPAAHDLDVGETEGLDHLLEEDRATQERLDERDREVGPGDRHHESRKTCARPDVGDARVGRQDFLFDLQRFVSSRDGPNVRQSFDAVWADWETGTWRLIGFVSRPVQYFDERPFDDTLTFAWFAP